MGKKCSTLECHSLAVAKSKDSGRLHCTECAIKVMKQWGPESLITLTKAKFPWKHPATRQCKNCGVLYNEYLISHTGGCPKCHITLPEYKNETAKN